jgi:hypothetical protein
MKAAHSIAKTLEGHYAARLSEGMKMAWAMVRVETSPLFDKMKVADMVACGYIGKSKDDSANDRKRLAQSFEANHLASRLGEYPLQGSEKQIVWATSIREKIALENGWAYAVAIWGTLTLKQNPYGDLAEFKKRMYAAFGTKSAAWWIDSRSKIW